MSSRATDKPSEAMEVEVKGEFDSLTEGKATILYDKGNKVFYNKVQEFNRDLSTAVINEFSKMRRTEIREKETAKAKRRAMREAKEKGIEASAVPEPTVDVPGMRILEALSATGLRSIRYWKEIEEGLLDEIVVNDLDSKAVEAITRNIKHNGISLDKLKPNHGDAIDVLYANRSEKGRGFDVVDLDPYGSAAMFLDGAVQAVADGGLLCVTCTDKAVLCGKNAETCYGKYQSMSIRAPYCHEFAVRIVLQAIEHSANRYKRHIIPLLSMSIDFYVRMFVRVKTSPLNVKSAASKMALVYQSLGCDAFYLQPLGKVDTTKKHPKYNQAIGPPCDRRCEFTGSRMKITGPIWAGPLHDKEFVKKLQNHVKANPKKYNTEKKMIGQLNVVETELENPLYYDNGCLTRLFRTNYRIVQLRSAILNAGYKVSQSHANGDAIKTDAPPKVIMDIMKQLVALKPDVGKAKRGPETPAGKMMAQEIEVKADFTLVPEATGVHAAFLPNPEENWGPKARAVGGGKRKFLTAAERAKQNQGFRKKKRDEHKKTEKKNEETDKGAG
eukprot:CAMPEP_0167792982 /NCGR_PEP_ID=MMETSP0111_2-20121227/12890_1 /TAXON_ID=91324 /ORGANISM="Lotharella globosa, Strain CCCM811" /LENGTH=555 /DNA_ID=CAMNT_0007686015 /DNA_START=27 /DNA_END=1694 /DNA_ORIENTATION=-